MRVVQDPVLEPVDKVVWLVLRHHAEGPDRARAFPTYTAIARQANVASPATISRCLAILRATRWLSLSARLRRPGGQFGGNVYALHEAPPPVRDALRLDPEYLRFLEEARRHPHARVRAVVRAVLESLDAELVAEVDGAAPARPVEGRPDAMIVPDDHGAPADLRPSARVRTRQGHPEGIPQGVGPLRNSQRADDRPALVYPASFAPEARAQADDCLRAVPIALRQVVLDELEGRIRSGQQGGQPVRNALGYLSHLCRRAQEGTFQPARGLMVQEERERRRTEAVSGYGRPEERERARAAGFDEYLAKPVDFSALARVLAARGDPAAGSPTRLASPGQ